MKAFLFIQFFVCLQISVRDSFEQINNPGLIE